MTDDIEKTEQDPIPDNDEGDDAPPSDDEYEETPEDVPGT